MTATLMLVPALVLVAAMGYAQANLRRFTGARPAELLTRAVLIGTGCALGYIYARQHPGDLVLAGLSFLIGLGAVHFPAAVILFIKKRRGSGKS